MSRFNRMKEAIWSKNFFKVIRAAMFIFFITLSGLSIFLHYFLDVPSTGLLSGLIISLFSLSIASHGIIIAIDSDEKMKAIATGDFYDLANRFWDRAPILYKEENKKERDTQSWQLGNLFRHAEKLKKWAESDTQERLIKEFTTFLERLRAKKCKKYWVEVKNYLSTCKIALSFKIDNDELKNKLIEELSNWLGEKNRTESNEGYLSRKSQEFSSKQKYEVFKFPLEN